MLTTYNELADAVAGWAVGEPLVRRIYLFGSRAKGTARPDSDIDLAILHDIDPAVIPTCEPDQVHMFTWRDHEESWKSGLQALWEERVDVWQFYSESVVIRNALRERRVCLYRRGFPPFRSLARNAS